MAITYENIFFNFVIDPLRDIMQSEYSGMKVYVAPEIDTKYSASTSMRYGEQVHLNLNMWGMLMQEFIVWILLFICTR